MADRHGHKGPETKRRQMLEAPFLSMSPAEFEETWDHLSLDSHRAILDESRSEADQMIVIAAAVLRRPGFPDVITMSAQDYGDNEAFNQVEDFAKACERQHLLQPGEILHVEMRNIRWTEMQPV